jgi:CheY-like chemotaxis protein/HPt (histidine-containing phosphotransfer) domain-containing protein
MSKESNGDGPIRVTRGLRVLLAEDNRINQALAVAMLEEHGCEVSVADNGREAVEIFENEDIDLVLMDVSMPEMDGVEAMRAIRKCVKSAAAHVPIVAMTANTMSGDREKYLRLGMDDYIPKPVVMSKLLQVIGHLGARVNNRTEEIEPQQADDDAIADLGRALSALNGNHRILRKMVSIFMEDHDRYTTELRETLERGDSEGLALVAHSIKGAAGIFAASRPQELALDLERKARSGALEGAAEITIELVTELGKLRDYLANYSERGELQQR